MVPIGLIFLSFLLLAGLASSLGIAALVIGRRLDTVWAKPLAILALIAALFMGTYLLELNSTGLEAKLFWGYVQYISKVFLPVSYLAFVLAYTESRWYTRWLILTLSIIPVLSLIFLWFDVGDLMYTEVQLAPSSIGPNVNASYGGWFWVHVIYSYSLLGVGAGILIRAMFGTQRGLSRLQMGILTICSIIPAVGALITVFDVMEVDLTPLLVGAMALIMGYALLKLRLFDIEPTRMATLENIADGYITLDLSNRVVDFNVSARRLLQKSTWQMRSTSLENFEVFSPKILAQLIQTDFFGRVEDTLTVNRVKRRYAIDVAPLSDLRQGLYGRMIFMRDITERSRLKKSQDNIIRALIHDLRSPISTTIGLLEMLQEDIVEGVFNSSDALDLLRRSNQILRNNIEVIEQTLELNRLEAGSLSLQIEPVDVEMLWYGVVRVMQGAGDQKTMTFEALIEPDLPPVKVDRLQIHRVLQNLVDNAIKFGPAGGRLEFRARHINPEGYPQIAVSVFNSGSTIPEDLQHMLFQKFIHGSHHAHGFGLGLAFCKMVVEAHGEKIWLERSDETGTTITFTLPVDLKAEAKSDPEPMPL